MDRVAVGVNGRPTNGPNSSFMSWGSMTGLVPRRTASAKAKSASSTRRQISRTPSPWRRMCSATACSPGAAPTSERTGLALPEDV